MSVMPEEIVAERARGGPTECRGPASILLPISRSVPSAEEPVSDPATTFDAPAWRRRLRVAQGQEPADLVLAGGEIVDVFSGDTYQADIAICEGVIAGVGSYPRARDLLDVAGKWICPSFIDAHVHTESALVWLPEFARAVVPHGTGAVVTDPHEIANVAGLMGMEAARRRARLAARRFDNAVLRTGQPMGITGG